MVLYSKLQFNKSRIFGWCYFCLHGEWVSLTFSSHVTLRSPMLISPPYLSKRGLISFLPSFFPPLYGWEIYVKLHCEISQFTFNVPCLSTWDDLTNFFQQNVNQFICTAYGQPQFTIEFVAQFKVYWHNGASRTFLCSISQWIVSLGLSKGSKLCEGPFFKFNIW